MDSGGGASVHSGGAPSILILMLSVLVSNCSDPNEADAVGSTASQMSCTQGDTRACLGPGRCEGAQACSDEGHWRDCDCGEVERVDAGIESSSPPAPAETATDQHRTATTPPVEAGTSDGAREPSSASEQGGSPTGSGGNEAPAVEPTSSVGQDGGTPSLMGGGTGGGASGAPDPVDQGGTGGSAGNPDPVGNGGRQTSTDGSTPVECPRVQTASQALIAARFEALLTGPEVDVLSRATEEGWSLVNAEDRATAFDALWDESASFDHVLPLVSGWFGLDRSLVGIDAAQAASFSTEAELLLGDLLTRDAALSLYFLADYSFMDDNVAAAYGVLESSANFESRPLPSERRGVTMLGAWLVGQRTPTLRGQSIFELRTCSSVPPPPPDVSESLPPEGESTTRERYSTTLAEPVCVACHQVMEPTGFGFLNFDETGTYRTSELGVSIDASGELSTGETFRDALELSELLATQDDVAQCLAQRALTLGLSSPRSSEAGCWISQLEAAMTPELSVREIFRAAVMSELFAAELR